MVQTKLNGSLADFQNLTANLVYVIVDEVDGADDISDFSTVGGNAEAVVNAISTVANPVILESGNARVMYMALEVGGADADLMQAAANAAGILSHSNLTVTAGTFTVV